MIGQGLASLFPMSHLSHMGLSEVAKHLGSLLGRIKETIRDIESCNPEILITIDSPDFCFRVGKAVKRSLKDNIRLIHYVAPSVWAWRPGRAPKIARFLDHLFTLFDFEPPYFEKFGLSCTFVGHPLVEEPSLEEGEKQKKYFLEKYGLNPQDPVLCLLPGSRVSEITRLLPVFLETFQKVRQTFPTLQGILPMVPSLSVLIQEQCPQKKGIHLIKDPQDKGAAFAASTMALAASGTVTLELALAGVPTLIGYKASPLTAFIVRFLIKSSYAGLPNILLNRQVMPEFIQERCTPELLIPQVEAYLSDPQKRERISRELQEVKPHLSGGQSPSQVAACVVVDLLSRKSRGG
jgi:lipid-A-disaccharide synthase